MREGKLRIGPTCYHTLHIVPIMAAHEMNFLYDEGLKTADGSLGYEILRDPMVPFGLEKLGIAQGMKERSVDIALDVQSRTMRAGRRRLHYRRLEKPATGRHYWPAPYQIPAGRKGPTSRHQRLQ